MRIGVTVPNVHETLAERTTIEAVARMADGLGYDSVWCNDHVVIPVASDGGGREPAYAAAYGQQRGQNIYEPLITLAHLAAVTRRVLLAAEEGLRLLLFFGDELQIPTTGVAIDPSVVALDDPRVQGPVRANLRALGALLDDPALGAEHVRRLLPRTDDASARDFYDRYIGRYFKRDGLPDPDVVARALSLVAAELEILTGRAITVPPADEIYRHDLTAAWTR